MTFGILAFLSIEQTQLISGFAQAITPFMDEAGVGPDGKVYTRPEELWRNEQGPDGTHSGWYSKAVEYWDNQEPTYNGVLGGFGHLSDLDIRDSWELLKKAFKTQLEQAETSGRRLVAVDCGAGVGRVTEQLLLHHFHEVDVLEPSSTLMETAKRKLAASSTPAKSWPASHSAGRFFLQGLQDFAPEQQRYDCIWLQWCLLYLTDDDLLALLQRCKDGLKPDGIVFVKENVCRQGFIVDKEDNSLSRSNTYLLALFDKAGLTVHYNRKQRHFPKELYEVRMYVLAPRRAAS